MSKKPKTLLHQLSFIHLAFWPERPWLWLGCSHSPGAGPDTSVDAADGCPRQGSWSRPLRSHGGCTWSPALWASHPRCPCCARCCQIHLAPTNQIRAPQMLEKSTPVEPGIQVSHFFLLETLLRAAVAAGDWAIRSRGPWSPSKGSLYICSPSFLAPCLFCLFGPPRLELPSKPWVQELLPPTTLPCNWPLPFTVLLLCSHGKACCFSRWTKTLLMARRVQQKPPP